MNRFGTATGLVLAAALVLFSSGAASAAGPGTASPKGVVRAVSVSLTGPAAAHTGAANRLPLLRVPRHGSAATAPATGSSLGVATSLAPAPALASLTAFPTTGEDDQIAKFGSDQNLEPPDTMLAAGPTSLLQTINSTATIWSKTGTQLGMADLNRVLPIPTGWSFSDPRILYDAPSGRFFFTGLAFSANLSSVVFVGVSKTSDPAGGFFVYSVAQSNTLHDQPKIGVSDDKVVVSWNDFCCGILFSIFRGAETWAFQKSTMLTGSATPFFGFGPNITQSSPVPAQSLTSTSTEYVPFNAGTSTGVIVINGTPAANNVTFNVTNVAMPATVAPPNAVQPGGTLSTNDDRFLSSVWQNDTLSVSGNTGCIPSGSLTTRSCMRLVQVSTAGTLTLIRAVDLGQAGVDVCYPAVTTDPVGDVLLSFTASSSTLFASAVVAEVKSGAVSGASVFQAGQATYGGTRWGDYSAISVDPASAEIWAAAEYAATGTNGHDWGTAAGVFAP